MEAQRTDNRPDDPVEHVLKVRLSDPEYRALVRHAISEDRTFPLQAARLIREGLEAVGVFPPEERAR